MLDDIPREARHGRNDKVGDDGDYVNARGLELRGKGAGEDVVVGLGGGVNGHERDGDLAGEGGEHDEKGVLAVSEDGDHCTGEVGGEGNVDGDHLVNISLGGLSEDSGKDGVHADVVDNNANVQVLNLADDGLDGIGLGGIDGDNEGADLVLGLDLSSESLESVLSAAMRDKGSGII